MRAIALLFAAAGLSAHGQEAEIPAAKVKSALDVRAEATREQLSSPSSKGLREAILTNPLPFFPVRPCRVLDTRNPNSTFGGPVLGAAASRTVPVAQSACGIPSTALAYSLNITVVPRGPLSYLTVYPAGSAPPLVSTLNAFEGSVVSNAAIVPAGAGGGISLFATNTTDVIVDINGYFGPGTGGADYYPLAPCRVADTRTGSGKSGSFGPPVLEGGGTRTLLLPQANCGVPADAKAYSLNVTVVPGGPLSFLTLYPAGQAQPPVSTLNSFTGRVTANAALVAAGASGGVSVFVTNSTHVIVDINGYFR
ncbi:MAG: hypothetical protein JNK87_36535 [Bryobacterales bacterium]|nr:hypothetical protein [Bryobacterales bacterium]